MVARYDAFADALTAGVLLPQAPLLLVPSQGPLPQAVSEELRRLGATQATILGGTAAVGAGVEAELGGLGLATTRLAGGDRVATAVAVAGFGARQAGTALLVRPHAGHPRRPRRRPHRDRALRRGGRRAPPARRRRCARRLRPGASYPVRRLDDPRTPADQASAARTDAYLTWDGRRLRAGRGSLTRRSRSPPSRRRRCAQASPGAPGPHGAPAAPGPRAAARRG